MSCQPENDLTTLQVTLETELNVLIRLIRKHKDFSKVRDSVYKATKKSSNENENCRKNGDNESEEDFTSLVAKYGKIRIWL